MIPGSLQFMPEQTAEAYSALKTDIELHGIQVPVAVDQHGRILDGNNRVKIATELGIEYPTETITVRDDDEAEERAIALNLIRRQVSQAQMRELIADQIERHPALSDRTIARRLGCSPTTVGTVRRPVKQVSNLDSGRRVTREEAEVSVQKLRAGVRGFVSDASHLILFLMSNGVDRIRIIQAVRDGETAVAEQMASNGVPDGGFPVMLYRQLMDLTLDQEMYEYCVPQFSGPEFLPMGEDEINGVLAVIADPLKGAKK